MAGKKRSEERPAEGGAGEEGLELLDVDGACRLLLLTRESLYSRIHRNQIPGVVRLGRSLRFRRAKLLEWIRQQEDGSEK
jgi:excisionase family DNA binding protein